MQMHSGPLLTFLISYLIDSWMHWRRRSDKRQTTTVSTRHVRHRLKKCFNRASTFVADSDSILASNSGSTNTRKCLKHLTLLIKDVTIDWNDIPVHQLQTF